MLTYDLAKERLDKPRRQDSKNIGHKLRLHRAVDVENGEHPIFLQYFNTDILTYRYDGSVIIHDGGWWTSQCTMQKINEHLPHGWRLNKLDLRYSRKQVGVVSIRTEKYELVRAMPYFSSIRLYRDKGRADLHSVNNYDAFDLFEGSRVTTEHTVRSFLDGELATVPWEASLDHVLADAGLVSKHDQEVRCEEFVINAVRSRDPSPQVLKYIQDRIASGTNKGDMLLYWKENFSGSGPAKTLRAKTEQLEFQMKTGIRGTRDPRNSTMFHGFRKYLLAAMEEFLLDRLGFEVKDKD